MYVPSKKKHSVYYLLLAAIFWCCHLYLRNYQIVLFGIEKTAYPSLILRFIFPPCPYSYRNYLIDYHPPLLLMYATRNYHVSWQQLLSFVLSNRTTRLWMRQLRLTRTRAQVLISPRELSMNSAHRYSSISNAKPSHNKPLLYTYTDIYAVGINNIKVGVPMERLKSV